MVYDATKCQQKKEIMRKMWNEAVEDGDSYKIIHACQTTSKFEKGLIFDTHTTSYYYYIVGYRRSDNKIGMVQVDWELTQHTEPFYVDMSAVVGVTYNAKLKHAWLLYRKNCGDYGEKFDISDSGSNSAHGITDMVQVEEREKFLDNLEQLRSRLEMEGSVS